MKRVWIVFWVFVSAAVWDLTLTIWNLGNIGFGFEGNPIAKDALTMILVKALAIVLVWWTLRDFEKQTEYKQYSLIGGLTMLILAQFYGGYTHLPTLQDYYQADEVIVGVNNVSMTFGNTTSVYVSADAITSSIAFLQIITLFFLYPYLYYLISVGITQWVNRGKK